MLRLRRNQVIHSFAQAETELPQSEILSKDAGPFFTFFFRCVSHIFAIHLFLFINNYGQASAHKVAYIFKVFGLKFA